MAWSDEARQAAADARAKPFDRSQIGMTVGATFSGKPLGLNTPTSAGSRIVSDIRAAAALGQGHAKSGGFRADPNASFGGGRFFGPGRGISRRGGRA